MRCFCNQLNFIKFHNGIFLLIFLSLFLHANSFGQIIKNAVVVDQLDVDFNDLNITDMIIDSSGEHLITTSNKGVFRFDGEILSPVNEIFETNLKPFYSSIISIGFDQWMVAGQGISILKNNTLIPDTAFPGGDEICIDLLNNGMGRIYALTNTRLYYRGINSQIWFEDTIMGLEGASQILQNEGLIMISSKSGLWVRSTSGDWNTMKTMPVISSISFKNNLYVVSNNGLEKYEDSLWVLQEKDLNGYHNFLKTKDGLGAWVFGESGLWFIDDLGTCTRLYTQGGLMIGTINNACENGSGGLLLAEEDNLTLINSPSVWYDLRTLPYNAGKINSISVISKDSCWLSTSLGFFSVGANSFKKFPNPEGGISIGILHIPGFGITTYGEFGIVKWNNGFWENIYDSEWVYDAIAEDGGIKLLTSKGVYSVLDFNFDKLEFIGTAFEKIPTRESKFKNDILGHSSFGLYNKSNKRDLNVFLDPAVFVREVDQSSEKSGELINIKLGIRGRSDISKIISLEYQLNDGLWISIGLGRRIVLQRLKPGKYELRVRAEELHRDKILSVSHHIEIEYPFWRRPEIFLSIFSTLFILIIIILYSYNKRRIDKDKWLKEKSQLERMALRLQMNPHFTFNALESISAYILNSEPKQAIVYLQKFSSLMRYTLESADQSYVFLDKEIGALENYIALEQMRFDSGFQSVIQLDPEIDRDSLAIPPMLIQPLVENSILHGLRPLIQQKRDNGLLKIYFMIHPQEENSLLIQIEDNGIGRKASRSNNTGDEGEKRSAATKILSKRLQAMSLESGFPHKVFVHDLNAGTRVSLVLPMIRNWEFSD